MKRDQKPGPGSPEESGPSPRQVSYKVRVYDKITVRERKRGTRYRVRWTVAGEPYSLTFTTSTLAKNHQAKLRTSANEGEPFDVETGLPVSMIPKDSDPQDEGPSWYEFAVSYVEMKWENVAPGSRRGIAESLAAATLALLRWSGRHPERAEVHAALSSWAFNLSAREAGCPPELKATISWVERNAVDLADLAETDVLRGVLGQLAQQLDGKRAAASTYSRKRATLFNLLSYAVEKEHFSINPLLAVSWTAPKNTEAVDRRRVVNEAKGRLLLVAVGHRGAMGHHLKAFFGCLFLAGFRPGEATALALEELELPDGANEWGWADLEDSSPQTSGDWTDSGQREIRQLKHRAEKETRPVPLCPPLVKMLRRHVAEFGTAPDGRLFRARNGGLLSETTYNRIWDQARDEALTRAEVRSVLAERPYDLRHARLSIWLNAGIAPQQVAEWAGNSMGVLLRVYAKCLTDSTETALEKLGRKNPKSVREVEAELPDLELDDEQIQGGTSTYELALSYLEIKWDTVKPTTRRNIIKVLTKVTMITLPREGPWPTDVQLGKALTSWAFNRDRWADIPDDQAEVIAWVEDHSSAVETFRDNDRLAAVLAFLSRNLDGGRASKAVEGRRRSTLFNLLEFAVRERELPSNPLLFRDWSGTILGHE